MDEYLRRTYTKKEIDDYLSSNAEESINLDFKRGDALRKGKDDKEREKINSDIAKDVSAFANSDGGIIVYGIEEKNFKADKLHYVNGNDFTKETLERIINTRIQRKIEGLIIDPIRYDDKIEQTIYVVKIPRSPNAPHMTSDKKFYRRYNFELVHMEEYEIRNLYTRQEKTVLEIAPPKIVGHPNSQSDNKIHEYGINIEFNIENKGQTIERFYKLEVQIPRLVSLHSNPLGNQHFFFALSRHENNYSFFSLPNTSPIFQNEFATIDKVSLKINRKNYDAAMQFPVILKLFYSNAISEYSFNLLDNLIGLNGNPLTLDDFK